MLKLPLIAALACIAASANAQPETVLLGTPEPPAIVGMPFDDATKLLNSKGWKGPSIVQFQEHGRHSSSEFHKCWADSGTNNQAIDPNQAKIAGAALPDPRHCLTVYGTPTHNLLEVLVAIRGETASVENYRLIPDSCPCDGDPTYAALRWKISPGPKVPDQKPDPSLASTLHELEAQSRSGQATAQGEEPVVHPEQPVSINGSPDAEHACQDGYVFGLNPKGDGFLAVKSRPDYDSTRIDKLYNGERIYVCAKQGEWYGLVYSRRGQECGVSRAWSVTQSYTGPCPSGWAHQRCVGVDERFSAATTLVSSSTKKAQCLLEVDGRIYLNRICTIRREASYGSRIFIVGIDEKYWAYVLIQKDGAVDGSWNAGNGSHAQTRLGTLVSLGPNCWANGHAKICATEITNR